MNTPVWLQKLLPQHALSRAAGCLARAKTPWLKNFLIDRFVRYFKVDLTQSLIEDYQQFPSFNAFFTRELKPGLRPQPSEPGKISSPVDGAISEFGAITEDRLFQAKGHYYSLNALLGGQTDLAHRFEEGAFLTAYLSPKDYHRVHMPVSGELKRMIHVPGALFSVNPNTVESVEGLFARNERVIAYFEGENGPMCVIFVGAIIVASIATTWHGIVAPAKGPRKIRQWHYDNNPHFFKQGDALGHFEVGSTIILLFPKNKIRWDASLKSGRALVLGQTIGESIVA